MEIEFDEAKSISNYKKHGIDFHEAKKLWDQPVVIQSSFYEQELRELHIGFINNKFWTAVITYRTTKLRIISVRRSREHEKAFYLYQQARASSCD